MTKKVIVCLDSFKGTISSIDGCKIIKEELLKKYSDIIVECVPLADGGEGTSEIIKQTNNVEEISFETLNANNQKITTSYLYFPKTKEVLIESAKIVGFIHKNSDSDPSNTTTGGIGLAIKDSLRFNPLKIYLSLGGTITNDGGCGMLSALGVEFFDEENKLFIPTGKTLSKIKKINNNCNLQKTEIIGLCDVDNPLLGIKGATNVFARQKGADEAMCELLEEGMTNFSKVSSSYLKQDNSNVKGSGAAGGLGFAVVSFLHGKLESGIKKVLNIVNFEKKVQDCDYIITGEGKLDSQSFDGKVISGVLNAISKYPHIKKIAIVGCSEKKSYPQFNKVFVTNIENKPFSEVKKTCYDDLKKCIQNNNILY